MFFPAFLRRFYIWISALLLVVIAVMAMLPRSDIAAHTERRPAFDLAAFFNGKSVAYGIFEDRFGNLRRQFRIEIEASQCRHAASQARPARTARSHRPAGTHARTHARY